MASKALPRAVANAFMVVLAALASAQEASPPSENARASAAPASAIGRVAAELVQALDADGDGASSRREFLRLMPRAVGTSRLDELGLGISSWEELFVVMDLDANGRVDVGEAEQGLEVALAHHFAPDSKDGLALSLAGLRALFVEQRREAATMSRLRSRAVAKAPSVKAPSARRLDDAAGNKARDPRCEAPKGFPNRPEGFVCLNETALIYCSHGRRWKGEESCQWRGTCRAGLVPDGGCDYPMCRERAKDGSFCEQNTVYRCTNAEANGRLELQSVRSEACAAGAVCRAWSDGPPPSRRRRTKTCAQSIFLKWLCYDDPAPPPYAACVGKDVLV